MSLATKILSVTLLILLLIGSTRARAEGPFASLVDTIERNGSMNVRALTFVTNTGLADSSRNPENRIMTLSHLTTAFHLRPDLRLDTNRFTFTLKPRAEIERQSISSKNQEEQQWHNRLYIQEWLARWQTTDSLYFSYGRENLQWGPASLTSLSNPFFTDNGKSNPKLEVGAMDFARVVWVPNPAWSVSLIANTDKGRGEISGGNFRRSYAIKADYTGSANYGSLVLTSRGHSLDQIGGFFGQTVSDALLVYCEGTVQRNPPGLYPEPSDYPLGYHMEQEDGAANHWIGSLLAGTAYTLASGPTLTLEYLYYGPGYNHTQARRFYSLQDEAAAAIRNGSAFSSLASQELGSSADPGLRFLRRNYLMLQYVQTNIADTLDLTLRLTKNLDDGSSRLSCIGEWYLGDHTQLFAVTTVDNGSHKSEFGSIIDYQAMLGVVYYF
jgi:hypothetical protein